jgi:hypothetical protein
MRERWDHFAHKPLDYPSAREIAAALKGHRSGGGEVPVP